MDREIITISIVGIIILGLMAYYIGSTLKGNIKIVLAKSAFSFGETLTGIINIEAKKIINCNRLYVKLVGNEIVKGKNERGESIRRSRVVYKKETEIHGTSEYLKGTKHSIPFQIELPDAFGLARAGSVEKFIANTLRNEYRCFEWKLSAHFNVKGIDLTDRNRIMIE